MLNTKFDMSERSVVYIKELEQTLEATKRPEIREILKARISEIKTAMQICGWGPWVAEIFVDGSVFSGCEFVFHTGAYYGDHWEERTCPKPLPIVGEQSHEQKTFVFDFAPGVSRVIVR